MTRLSVIRPNTAPTNKATPSCTVKPSDEVDRCETRLVLDRVRAEGRERVDDRSSGGGEAGSGEQDAGEDAG
jgi:hypothetical protein